MRFYVYVNTFLFYSIFVHLYIYVYVHVRYMAIIGMYVTLNM